MHFHALGRGPVSGDRAATAYQTYHRVVAGDEAVETADRTHEAGQEPVEYNPFLPEVHEDPYPLYHRLRRLDPVHWNLPGIWILTRHADAVAMLRHPGMGSDYRNSDLFAMLRAEDPEAVDDRDPSMLFRDPPDHTRLRNLVSKAFSARMIEGLRPLVEATVDRLLDELEGREELELVSELAHPLPVFVICHMLGVPARDRELFSAWSDDLVHTLDPMAGPDVMARGAAAEAAFEAYFLDLIAERRRRPRDDLLTALVDAEDSGARLSGEELIRTLILLLVAGHETTVNLITNGTLALLRNQDERRRLREDPSLMRGAVEELLRYDSPVQLAGRVVMRDLELGGVAMRPGQQVVALVGAANRDPAAFPDPDRLDLGRLGDRHIAFGGGIHHCLGATLARVEGRAAIGALVARYPRMEVAGRLVRRDTITLRGLERFPVAVTP